MQNNSSSWFCRVASMIFQFKDGLNSCGGLWDMIEAHWEMFSPVMTSVQKNLLTLRDFQQLFTVCYNQSAGSLRAAEEETVRHWETVLEEVRGKNRRRESWCGESLRIGMTCVDEKILTKMVFVRWSGRFFFWAPADLHHGSWSSPSFRPSYIDLSAFLLKGL